MVSIIVPVYNAEQYLEQCIDSILCQSYTDYELILINDGSSDGSARVCDQYAEKDKRVRVIHQKNAGVSHARNVGIDNAAGEYIVFCDSDDYVEKDYLYDLVSSLPANSDADTLVLSNLSHVTPDGGVSINSGRDSVIELDNGNLEDYLYLVERYAIYGPYCKLYIRKVFETHHLRFREQLKSAEDFDFNIRYIEHMRFIQTLAKSQYYYRVGYKKVTSRFIDESSIASAHIMSAGLSALARRMGVFEECYPFLAHRTAEKHWLSRLPSVFAKDKQKSIRIRDRKSMYDKLLGNQEYRSLCRDGIGSLSISPVTKLAALINSFPLWLCFFGIQARKT